MMKKQAILMLVLVGLLVISQVESLTSGGLQLWRKRATLQEKIRWTEQLRRSACSFCRINNHVCDGLPTNSPENE
eukprot:gene4572-5169_t